MIELVGLLQVADERRGEGGRGVDGLGGALVVNLPRVDVEIALLYKSASTEWESSVYILFVIFNLLGHV